MKSFFNNAIIGNSRILATMDDKSKMLRIFWPHLDYSQHIDEMLLGVYFPNSSNNMHWIDSNEWRHVQYYLEDTNILRTVITSQLYEIMITITDFVLPDKDVIVRNIEFENASDCAKSLKFCLYASGINSKTDHRSSFFDQESDSLVLFRHSNYLFISADKECKQFQLTNDPLEACNKLFLYGIHEYSLTPQGAMIWEIGEIGIGQKTSLNLYMAFDKEINSARDLCEVAKNTDYKILFNDTKKYWSNFLKTARKVNTDIFDFDQLYKRSILTLKMLVDKSGGIIAAPECDEEAVRCGRYGYCWPRDAAFITTSLDRAGLLNISRKFYEWAIEVQDDTGVWHQRYFLDGNLASSWGLQIDETGAILWGIWQHYLISKDLKFLESVWNGVYKASGYLMESTDPNNGLPALTYDLWEERFGQHCYTSVSVHAALVATVNIAKELKKDKEFITRLETKAEELKAAIETNFWDEGYQRFLRSINVKINEFGEEFGETIRIVINKKGYFRDFSVKDSIVDTSLIGLCIPYEVFDPNDPRIISTVKAIEERLACDGTGGIKRYENDNYIGGNPWIVTTLWLARYYIKIGDFEKAKELLIWASNHKTKLGLLPEQIDKFTGEPAWVIPLTWSHAMYLHVLFDLIDNNII